MGQTKPYADRTDLERLASSWVKHQGFMDRGECSAAIVRAATAAEIAANIVIRHELETERNLEKVFVDSLLQWANGLDGKIKRIIMQLPIDTQRKDVIRSVTPRLDQVIKKRNQIVHSGNFMNINEANEVHGRAREFIDALVGLYHAGYSVDTAAADYKKSRPKPENEKLGVQIS